MPATGSSMWKIWNKKKKRFERTAFFILLNGQTDVSLHSFQTGTGLFGRAVSQNHGDGCLGMAVGESNGLFGSSLITAGGFHDNMAGTCSAIKRIIASEVRKIGIWNVIDANADTNAN